VDGFHSVLPPQALKISFTRLPGLLLTQGQSPCPPHRHKNKCKFCNHPFARPTPRIFPDKSQTAAPAAAAAVVVVVVVVVVVFGPQ